MSKRIALPLLLTTALAACANAPQKPKHDAVATASTSATPAVATSASQTPPPNDNLNAVAWTQTAIEHDLIYREVFRDAGEKLERATGSRSEIKQEAERTAAQRFAHRGFYFPLGNVERPDPIPIRRMLFKEGLRRCLTLAFQCVGPFAVEPYRRFGRVHVGNEPQCQAAARLTVGNVKINPAAFAEALDQARLVQELQMAADARLALPQDERQILNVELSTRKQEQNAQTRRLGRRLQRRNQIRCFEFRH